MEHKNMLIQEDIAYRTGVSSSIVLDIMNVCQTQNNVVHLSREARAAVSRQLLGAIKEYVNQIPPFLIDIAKLHALADVIKSSEDRLQDRVAQKLGDDDKQVSSSLWRRFLYDYELTIESEELEDAFSNYQSAARPIYIYDKSMRRRVYGHDNAVLTQLTSELIEEFADDVGGKNASMDEVLCLKKKFCDKLGLCTSAAKDTTLTVCAKKGGVGKSAITTGIAGALALTSSRPYKVLVIDIDDQGSTTHLLSKRDANGRKMFSSAPSIFDVLVSSKSIDGRDSSTTDAYNKVLKSAMVETSIPNVHIIQASSLPFPFDKSFKIGRTNSDSEIKALELKHVIEDAKKINGYDFVIIDSRPDLHTSSKLAIAAGDVLISVMRPSGEDREAFVGYLSEVAVDVLPEIIDGDNWKMPKLKIIYNQVNKKLAQQRFNIDVINSALHVAGGWSSSFNAVIFENQVISSSSSIDYSIWSVPREYVSNISAKNLGAFRAQFTNIALEIEDAVLIR